MPCASAVDTVHKEHLIANIVSEKIETNVGLWLKFSESRTVAQYAC